MSVTVVVGGQYGSEGKGKLVSYLACKARSSVAVVRCGGPNAGHTAVGNGLTYQLRQIPSGVVEPRAHLYLAAGMVIDLEVLFDEILRCEIGGRPLVIDRNACVLSEEDRRLEGTSELRDRVGSTLSGTGSATARKVLRDPDLRLVRDVAELHRYEGNVSRLLNQDLDDGYEVIVEGTQGFGLSLHHVDSYPFVTSRDTTAAAFLSEAGLSPTMVSEIYMVLRTFPIRVAGNSGPMYSEIDWAEVTRLSGYPRQLAEFTTVTRKLRRVGLFDWELARQAAKVNRPTGIAIHGIDYINYSDFGKSDWAHLSEQSKHFVLEVEDALQVPVCFVFTGPSAEHMIDRRADAWRETEPLREATA